VLIQTLDKKGGFISMGILTATALLSFIMSFFIVEDLRRMKHEKATANQDGVHTQGGTTLGNLSCEETARDLSYTPTR